MQTLFVKGIRKKRSPYPWKWQVLIFIKKKSFAKFVFPVRKGLKGRRTSRGFKID